MLSASARVKLRSPHRRQSLLIWPRCCKWFCRAARSHPCAQPLRAVARRRVSCQDAGAAA
eukprot:4053784-Lingulodinium_polyedra.AAC.1